MKTNGLVFRGALALPLLFASICPAEDAVELASIQTALTSATSLQPTLEAATVETVAFDRVTAASRNPFFYGSVEMLFLDINADTGGRITASFNDSDTVGTDISFNTGTGVQDEFGIGARTVIGRQFSDKWGMAARYFHLEDTETGFPRLTQGTTPLPTFGTYTETDTLKMYSIDLEAVRSFNPGKTKIDTTFGARQASLDVDSLFHAFGNIADPFVNLNLSNGCAFDGAGITSALTFRRQIGDSCASLFAGGRGSKMWGHTDSFGRAAGAAVLDPNPPLSGAATVSRNNATTSDLVILEAQAGVQFEFALRDLPATAFFRLAGEYQDWDINGPPTGGAGFGNPIGDLTINSFASAGLGDTELVGGTAALGFTW